MNTFVLPVTALYAGVNIMLLVSLAFLVVHHRIANQVALGHNGIEALERAIRTHGNLTEYVPSGLILLALLELNSLPGFQLYVLGGLFTFARASHIHGMLTATQLTRTIGAMFTVITMMAMAGQLLVLAF